MPMQKTVYIEKSEKFLWENNEKFSLLQNTNFMNAVSRLEYTINMIYREQILLMPKQILSMQKRRFDCCEIQTWKTILIWHLNLEDLISLSDLRENSEQFFK